MASIGVITYYFFDLTTLTLIGRIPVTGATWSQRLNGVGSFAGNVMLTDPGIKSSGAATGLREGRTIIIVDIDGAIEWCGLLWTSKYQHKSKTLQLGGNESWSYWSQRLQAADYSMGPSWDRTFWSTVPADPLAIAAQLIWDASKISGTPDVFFEPTINIIESPTNPNTLTVSYPISSLQPISSMVSTLASSGWMTGFDYAVDVSWGAGQGSYPVFVFNLSYPRRGRIAGSTGLTISTRLADDYEWDVDSTQQANSITGAASGSGTLQSQATDPTVIGAGWPLLESAVNMSAINAQSQLDAAVEGQIAITEWPVVTTSITTAMFGSPAIGEFIMGDDVRLIVDPDERFPTGVDTYMRITGLDAVAADTGRSTMKLTLTMPPALAPVSPPPGI